ncbi:hypothetical protein Syun_012575 [Stephania yunnanensis]|uniref:Uncharacterized protein n=1 Tax=Stephania yunnanensis TaxID=152371 RepID=A0AAP0K1X1_9MAGN
MRRLAHANGKILCGIDEATCMGRDKVALRRGAQRRLGTDLGTRTILLAFTYLASSLSCLTECRSMVQQRENSIARFALTLRDWLGGPRGLRPGGAQFVENLGRHKQGIPWQGLTNLDLGIDPVKSKLARRRENLAISGFWWTRKVSREFVAGWCTTDGSQYSMRRLAHANGEIVCSINEAACMGVDEVAPRWGAQWRLSTSTIEFWHVP